MSYHAGVREAVAVPFLDLKPAHAPLKDQILSDIAELIDTGAFANGSHIAQFEEAFARYCGTASAVGVASGLDALRLGLLAGGLECGDEVIVPANTFIASFEAITQAGGVPVPLDVTEDDYNLDVSAVADAIGDRTRFAMPVHLYGQMADLRRLTDLVERHGLRLIEDACQAHGATRDGLRAGAVGVAAAFSFYPGKNLGAMGDAGALTTNEPSLVAQVRALREHGQVAKYEHHYPGWTSRLDTMQAIALLHKLPHLDDWNEQRRATAAAYAERLVNVGDLRLPPVPEGSDPVWHLYVVRTERASSLAGHLLELGISTGRHYPQPVHLSQAYASLGYRRGAFPVTEQLSAELLSLPMFPGISEQQIESVCVGIAAFFDGA